MGLLAAAGGIFPLGLGREPELSSCQGIELADERLRIIPGNVADGIFRPLVAVGDLPHHGLPERLGDFHLADLEMVQRHLVLRKFVLADDLALLLGAAHQEGAAFHGQHLEIDTVHREGLGLEFRDLIALARDLVLHKHLIQFLRESLAGGNGQAKAHIAGLGGRSHRLARNGFVVLFQGAAAAEGVFRAVFRPLRIDRQESAQVIGPPVGTPFPGAAGHALPLAGRIFPLGLRRKPERNPRRLGELLEELLRVPVADHRDRGRRNVLRAGIRAHHGLPEGLRDFRCANSVAVQDHLVQRRRPEAAHVEGLAHGERAGLHRRQSEGNVLHRKGIHGIRPHPGREVHGAGYRSAAATRDRQYQGGRPHHYLLHRFK